MLKPIAHILIRLFVPQKMKNFLKQAKFAKEMGAV